jgi:hypothetical protein
MKTNWVVGVVAVGCLGMLVGTQASAGDKKGSVSTVKEENCGAMIKGMVPLPTKFAELMTAVADTQAQHASWVGMGKDPASQAEATAMRKLAEDHRTMATDAKKVATDMEAASTMRPAPHDRAKMDQKAMTEAMSRQIRLEREMASLMMKDADETERRLTEMNKATTTSGTRSPMP